VSGAAVGHAYTLKELRAAYPEATELMGSDSSLCVQLNRWFGSALGTGQRVVWTREQLRGIVLIRLINRATGRGATGGIAHSVKAAIVASSADIFWVPIHGLQRNVPVVLDGLTLYVHIPEHIWADLAVDEREAP
jgi:hypothetical protein